MRNLLATLSLLVLVGCGSMPLRPGRAQFVTQSGTAAQVRQSQNPQQETTQIFRHVEEPVPSDPKQTRVTEVIETKIGAAQKDTAREIGAKLGALKGVVWLGVLVFLFGAASFVYPPLKVIVGGSVTTSAVISAAGLALIVLPSLLVGHELLILGVSAGAAAFWFFAHRHGGVQAELKLLKDQAAAAIKTVEGK